MQKKTVLMSIILICLLVVSVGAYLWFNKSQPTQETTIKGIQGELVNIVAQGESAGLIPIETRFDIQTTAGMSEATLKALLVMEPQIPMVVKKESDTLFSLTPESVLPKHTMIRFSFKNQDRLAGWAFQTVDAFRIKSNYPANESQNVDVKTGIEIEFTQPVDDRIKDFITLLPVTPYELKIQGTQVIILPKSLEKDVLYVVSVNKGYGIPTGEELLQDFRFSFSTGNVTAYTNSNTMSMVLMTPEMPKRLSTAYYNEEPLSLKLYELQDAKSYETLIDIYLEKAKYYKNPGKELKLDQLKPIIEEIVSPSMEDYTPYVYLPEDLGKGFYLALTDDGSTSSYAFFQITDYAIYAEASDKHVLFFGINTETQALMTKATVTAKGKDLGSFNQEGIAVIKEAVTEEYYVIENGAEFVYFPLKNSLYTPWTYNNDYPLQTRQVFLYTDRPTYKPNDELALYGIINPEKNETLQNIRVEIKHGWMNSSLYFNQSFSLDDYQSFTTKVSLKDYEIGYYQIRAFSGEKLLAMKSFNIEDYVLPEFAVDQSIDKEVIINGEEVTIRGGVNYFDGTPLKAYELSAQVGSYYSFSQVKRLKTDTDGRYQWQTSPVVPYDSWRPIYYGLKTSNFTAENVEIGHESNVYLFPSDLMLRGKGTVEETVGQLNISTHQLIIPKNAVSFGEDYVNLKGKAVDTMVNLTIKENYYEKVSQGEVYDPIRKKNIERFTFEYRENTILNNQIQTLEGSVNINFDTLPGRMYLAEIKAVDGYGTTLIESVYLNNTFYNTATTEGAYFDTYQKAYKVGDVIEQSLVIPKTADLLNDKTLFISYQNQYVDYVVSEEPVYKSTFQVADIPNRIIKAIYYDGTKFNISPYQNTCSLQLDETEKVLDIEISGSQSVYSPGDTATITVKTSVQGAAVASQVLLNVVDEAYYAAYEDYSNIRRELYASNYNTGIVKHYYPGMSTNEGMAEGGEGDAASALTRSIFKDTAAFLTIQTGNDGVGTASFKLPDNLTTWRVTSHGVTKDLEAGMARGKVKVSLPFFVKLLKSADYIVGEEPSMILRADGDGVVGNDPVAYSVKLTLPDGTTSEQKITGNAYDFTPVSLGKLVSGDYSYEVTGTQGSLRDGLAGKFQVVDSRVSFDAFRTIVPTVDFSLKNPVANTQLTFWNTAALHYMDLLVPILNSSSERVEWIIAEAEADKLLFKGQEDSWYQLNALNLLPLYLDYTGGLKPLQASEADLYTTVQVASVNQDYLSKGSTIHYFNSFLILSETTRRDSLLALWGLAVYNEPVLHRIKSIDVASLKDEEKLIYAAALAELGDLESSYSIYKSFSPETASAFKLETLYALANLGTAFAGDKTAEVWFDLALKATTEEHVFQLQQVKFLKHLKNQLAPVTLKALVGGEQKEWVLDTNASETILIKANETFQFTEIIGDVTLQENFRGNLSNVDVFKNDQYKINRTVSNLSPVLSEVVQVKIVVSYPANGWARLQDSVPSGFAPMNEPFKTAGYPLQFFVGSDKNNTETLTYELRAKQTGTLILEPLVMTIDGSSFMMTEPIEMQVSGE
jgi:hypothetical protein